MADKINFTPSQKKAIETREKALLLSAAAGSGKTAVLVERILRLISDENNPTNIDNLLIVTFTNLAASQMRERIHKELIKRIKQNPQNKKLKNQLMLLPGACIKTIHSFCLDTIKANINCVDIPVNYRIADDAETKSMKNRVISEMIEEKYSMSDTAFLRLIDTYGYARTEDSFIEMVLGFFNTVKSLADEDAFFKMCLENLENAKKDFSSSVFSKLLINYAKDILDDHIRKYDFAIELSRENEDIIKNHDFFIAEQLLLKKTASSKTADEWKNNICEFTFPRKPSGKGEDNELLKAIRTACIKDVDVLKGFFSSSVKEEEENLNDIYIYISDLISFIKEFDKKFSELKRKRGVIDYSDFEHMTYRILKNSDGTLSDVSLSYREKFHEVLVDEYQDTSDIQNAIFDAVSKDGKNLFAVGDVKQCIYKFREAKPENFVFMEDEYQKDGIKKELILLKENFRSRKEILDCVNGIFLPIMTKSTGLTDYSSQQLVCGGDFSYNKDANYKTEILLFDRYSDDISEEYETYGKEALMITQRIKELMCDKNHLIYDKDTSTFRPLEYKDIVILVRGASSTARTLYDCLNEFNIPVTADFSENYFEQVEIQLIMGILKCIDNPRDDISLITFLKSPLFAFSEDELVKLRLIDKKSPFYDALLKSDDIKAKKAVEVIKELIDFSLKNDISDLVLKILNTFSLAEKICAYKNPKQRAYNLDMFYNIALNYDDTHFGTLKSFIFYIDKAVISGKNVSKITNTIEQNAVRIMTMHKSKGLEFPVVFVSGLGDDKQKEESRSHILLNTEYGIAANYINENERYYYPTLSKSALSCKIKEERIGEEMRLLYVALTRAKDKLIITACPSSKLEKCYSLWEMTKLTGGFTKNSLLENERFIDWIMPSATHNELFEIRDFSYSDIKLISKAQKEEDKKEDDLKITDDENIAFYEYENKENCTLPTKITVSQVNKLSRDNEIENFSVMLDDLDSIENTYSASEYGTYFHKLFELIDHNEIKTGKTVETLANDLIEKNLISEYEYTKRAITGIESFYKTDIGKELISAEEVYKETPFLVRISAKEIFKNAGEENILLQGTSDCYFIKDKKITLIDFKTNKNPDAKKIKAEYSRQLELYSYAISKVTELEVIKKVVYTSENGEIIEI